jgi:hypothetical protein
MAARRHGACHMGDTGRAQAQGPVVRTAITETGRVPEHRMGRSAHTRRGRWGRQAPAVMLRPGARWVYCFAT